jgi:hypothetical protein
MKMSVELHKSAPEEDPYVNADGTYDVIVEEIWQELDKQLPRERVRCVITEIAPGFQDAMVRTFIPIFIHRRALEKLRQEINEIISKEDYLLDEMH